MNKRKLIDFLYGESQVRDALDGIPEDLVDLIMDDDGGRPKKPDPLKNVLKKVKVDFDDAELVKDSTGYALVSKDNATHRSRSDALLSSDAAIAMAELGWVAALSGDVAMNGEEPEFKIRFIEISTAGDDGPPGKETIDDIVKAAIEFATAKDKPDATDESVIDVDKLSGEVDSVVDSLLERHHHDSDSPGHVQPPEIKPRRLRFRGKMRLAQRQSKGG